MPAGVPSVAQSSMPCASVRAANSSWLPSTHMLLGCDAPGPVRMFASIPVPPTVPSLAHSSMPCPPSSAVK